MWESDHKLAQAGLQFHLERGQAKWVQPGSVIPLVIAPANQPAVGHDANGGTRDWGI